MRGIYDWFGLSVAHISQSMPPEQRRAVPHVMHICHWRNQVGFDHRGWFGAMLGELVQRPPAFVVIDEADSILTDEARIPLVIAGGVPEDPSSHIALTKW